MKTPDDIIKEIIVPIEDIDGDLWYSKQACINAMEAWADEKTTKYKELIDARDELIKSLNIDADIYCLTFNSPEDRVLFFESIIRNEARLREKIEQLKSEIQ